MLDSWPQLHLVTSMVWFPAYLRAAIDRHPDRVLLGSDFPGGDPVVATTAIQRLGLADGELTLVTGENLRFVLARSIRLRERAPAADELRFPLPPTNAAQLDEQGFEIVPADSLPASEPMEAKAFWSGYGVRSWYQDDKPWTRVLVDLVSDLRPASVLEFGCNVGRNLAAIAEALPETRLVGLDVNEAAVAAGVEETGLDLRCADEAALTGFADGEFDLVFTVSVLDHVADVDPVLEQLVRCAGRAAYFLEVALPAEGKVVRHFDHVDAAVRESTGASYSWDLERRLRPHPRIWRLDVRPVYLHARALGPYYASHLAWLDPPGD
jgi:SAM-dependent methyltransferase